MMNREMPSRREASIMIRTYIFLALAFALAAPAAAQDTSVDNSSSVDKQATETYSKNARSPVPAAPRGSESLNVPPSRIPMTADEQARQTYQSNFRPPVPAAPYYQARVATTGVVVYRHRHHRHRHRHHTHSSTTTAPPQN